MLSDERSCESPRMLTSRHGRDFFWTKQPQLFPRSPTHKRRTSHLFFFSFFFFVSRKSFSCPPSENQRHSSAAAKVTNLLVWVQEIRFGKTKRSCQPGGVRPAAPASDCLRSGRLVAPPPCSYTVRAHSSN